MIRIYIIVKYVGLVFISLWGNNLLAQDFELIRIGSAYYPQQSIEESSLDGVIGFFEWSGQLAIPQTFKKNKKTILIHKLGYANLRADLEGTLPFGFVENTIHYHTISYSLDIVQTIKPKWRLLFSLNPTLASDFRERLSGDDLLFQANAMAIYSKNEKTKYGFGVAYTTRFGRQLAIPMGLFEYNTPKMNLNILLPAKLSILFNTPNKTFFYGLDAGLNGGLFNNTSDTQIINSTIDEAGYSRLNIGPAIAVRLKNAIKIHFTGGISVGRRLELIDVDEEIIDSTPEPGPFFRVGLAFVPQKKKEQGK